MHWSITKAAALRRLAHRPMLYLMLGTLLLLGAGKAGAQSTADTLHVRTGSNLPTLEAALSKANRGDFIMVHGGTYAEHDVVIDKPVTIEGRDRPVIDGERKGMVLIVKSDSVTIRGLEIRHAKVSYINDNAGLLLDNVQDCLVEDNVLIDNFFAIYLSKSANCTVRGNRIKAEFSSESGSGNGIHLWYCKNITIENNHVVGQRDGIYFEFVQKSLIRDNYSAKNLRYGLHFMFSDSCRYLNNTFENNSAGVAVMYTDYVEMRDNLFIHNWGSSSYGLLLKEISDSKVVHNRFVRNSIGVYSEASNRILVKNNQILNNGWGVQIMGNSVDNRFVDNNFIGNSFDVSTNSRQDYNHFNHNYWSRYDGYDLDRDGIGDIPYRPVRLFSFIVERYPQSIVLLRSLLIDLLDTAERFMPVLTPETLRDNNPVMNKIEFDDTVARSK